MAREVGKDANALKLTILTPSYNRGNYLKRLYGSLCGQTNKEFIWLLIDDGSTDDTGEIAGAWTKEASIPVQYCYQENGGKHTALNRGIAMTETPLLLIVDSDDYLPEDAVSTILAYHDSYADRVRSLKLCGYSFLRAYSDGSINGGEYPVDEEISSYRDGRINAGIAGDRAEVFYTEILKQYPFPVFEGERFLPEDAVWMKMSGPYNLVHVNRVIYISDYLEGGLTRSGRRMKMKSPLGMMYRSAVYMNDDGVSLKTRIKMSLLYHIYRNVSNKSLRERESGRLVVRHDAVYLLTWLPGILICYLWKIKYRKK